MSVRPISAFELRLTVPKAWTASSDGTTLKGVNAVSHFATFPPGTPPTNEAEGDVYHAPHRRFLGTTREVNHKTSTQLENWIGLFADVESVYNESPGGSKDPLEAVEIGCKATGYSGDHAADQMRLSRELYAHKMSCDYRLRGAEAMKSKPEEEIRTVVDETFSRILAEIGDWKGWESRSVAEQRQVLGRLIGEVCDYFGKLAFDELPVPLRRFAGLWRWSGCCMHKELNTFKGGAVRMNAFWKKAGLKGPVPLLSQSSERQEEATSTDTTDHELGQLSGGAAKLTDLVGALVRNKVETKGCPDEFRTFSKDRLGYEISFAEISHNRYQSYGDAATELIWHPSFYIDFLDQHGKKKKRAAGLNHMEKNIVKGLEDPPTWTELAVFSLYSEAISKPYAVAVRGSINESKNALDLGPIHLQIITHHDTLINDPSLLIGDNASHETGALYGTHWDEGIINHILSIRNDLPHLQQALVAFLEGSREKWVTFTNEYREGSEIANSTPEERRLSFRSPTNDHCEGAGATWKQLSRYAPSMTTHQKNARLFIQLNSPDVETFIHDLPEDDRAFARGKAREMDAAKLPAKEREAQARANHEAVDEEQREAERLQKGREEREADEVAMVEGFQPILNRDEFLALPGKKPDNDFLRCQLVWHRRVGGDKLLPPGKFSSMNKAQMKKLVVEALDRRDRGTMMDIDMVDSELEDVGSSDAIVDVDMTDSEFGDTGSLGTELDAMVIIEDNAIGCESNYGCAPQHNSNQPTATPRCDPPRPVFCGGSNPLSMDFGCQWDSVDYSCSYDCVFTIFVWIYIHATRAWRETWIQESQMASFLSGHFERILFGMSGPTPNQAIPPLLTEGRDKWRDLLSQSSPTDFPRRGSMFASVTVVLEALANDRNLSYFTTILLSCGTPGCPPVVKNLRPSHYMLTPADWSNATGKTTLPYHESLEVWIKSHHSSPYITRMPDRCGRCQQPFSRKLVFREPTWTWFEVFPQYQHVIIPALKISLGSVTLQLAAIIYHNGSHYRARLCDPSETWWFYDGKCNRGRLTSPLKITNEGELFHCGDHYGITALIYCLACW